MGFSSHYVAYGGSTHTHTHTHTQVAPRVSVVGALKDHSIGKFSFSRKIGFTKIPVTISYVIFGRVHRFAKKLLN